MLSAMQVALGEPELPVILEMISGMKLGGKRRVLLPPSSDLRPQSGGGEMSSEDTIRFDVEVRCHLWFLASSIFGMVLTSLHDNVRRTIYLRTWRCMPLAD